MKVTIFSELVLNLNVINVNTLIWTPISKYQQQTPLYNSNINRVNKRTYDISIKAMYDTIKDYHDSKGRQLSLIFMKLPNKNEYPDYYEVIKQPMNMEKIASTLKNNGYENLDELVSDFILMFDNACKYNEPDSQIYKVCTFLLCIHHII